MSMAHDYGPPRPMGPGATAPAAPPIVTPLVERSSQTKPTSSLWWIRTPNILRPVVRGLVKGRVRLNQYEPVTLMMEN